MSINIVKYIGSQFANPNGFGGKISTFLMNRLNQKQYKSVINELSNKHNNIFDIGFGNGYLLSKISELSKADLFGIDVSSDMLSTAKQKLGSKANLSLGDVVSLSYDSNTFDYIYTVNTVYFWSDIENGLSEVYRTLNSNGTFMNVFYTKQWLDKLKYTNYDFAKYSPQQLKEYTTKVGFKDVELIEIKKDCSYYVKAKKYT